MSTVIPWMHQKAEPVAQDETAHGPAEDENSETYAQRWRSLQGINNSLQGQQQRQRAFGVSGAGYFADAVGSQAGRGRGVHPRSSSSPTRIARSSATTFSMWRRELPSRKTKPSVRNSRKRGHDLAVVAAIPATARSSRSHGTACGAEPVPLRGTGVLRCRRRGRPRTTSRSTPTRVSITGC